jgi:hypothetical protein
MFAAKSLTIGSQQSGEVTRPLIEMAAVQNCRTGYFAEILT